MKKLNAKWLVIPGAMLLVAGCAAPPQEGAGGGGSRYGTGMKQMPFGGQDSVDYAVRLWSATTLANLTGPQMRPDRVYQGTHPHGAMLETLSDSVTVSGHSGEVIVKRNYGGPGITADKVAADRGQWLKAVTVMYKREAGYDSADQDWFWVKYKPDGSLFSNPKGMKLAGRVAKGMPTGCIACHKSAPGGDMLFTR